MNYVTPERAGISSDNVRRFVEVLEEKRLSTHSLLLARGENIFF